MACGVALYFSFEQKLQDEHLSGQGACDLKRERRRTVLTAFFDILRHEKASIHRSTLSWDDGWAGAGSRLGREREHCEV
jgi:hypothetical protein